MVNIYVNYKKCLHSQEGWRFVIIQVWFCRQDVSNESQGLIHIPAISSIWQTSSSLQWVSFVQSEKTCQLRLVLFLVI